MTYLLIISIGVKPVTRMERKRNVCLRKDACAVAAGSYMIGFDHTSNTADVSLVRLGVGEDTVMGAERSFSFIGVPSMATVVQQ